MFQQSGDFEVIVVDGGSGDNTRQLAAREPRVRLLVASEGRAAQMNGRAMFEALGGFPARSPYSRMCCSAKSCFELRLPLARLPAQRFFSDIR